MYICIYINIYLYIYIYLSIYLSNYLYAVVGQSHRMEDTIQGSTYLFEVPS